MDILERDITSIKSNNLTAIRSIEHSKKNKDSKWEDIELQVISNMPTGLEFDISDLKNEDVISVDENNSIVIEEAKKNDNFSLKDVVKIGVESVEILLSLPALPVMVTANYFSKELGESVKKACYSYREKLYHLRNKIV